MHGLVTFMLEQTEVAFIEQKLNHITKTMAFCEKQYIALKKKNKNRFWMKGMRGVTEKLSCRLHIHFVMFYPEDGARKFTILLGGILVFTVV